MGRAYTMCVNVGTSDGVKLDGCGAFRNLSVWAELLNKTGRPVLIEDCHWGGDGPVSHLRWSLGSLVSVFYYCTIICCANRSVVLKFALNTHHALTAITTEWRGIDV
jgi:hypothetical protein